MIHVNAFHSITLVIFRQFKVNKQRYEHHGAYIQSWFINRQPKIFKRDLSHRKVKLGLKLRPNAKNKETGGGQWRCNGDGKMRTQRTVHLLPNFTNIGHPRLGPNVVPRTMLISQVRAQTKGFRNNLGSMGSEQRQSHQISPQGFHSDGHDYNHPGLNPHSRPTH